jgi:peptidoglycan/LPS O-acetylase OafA/YrhL
LFPLILATPGSVVCRILSLRVFRAVGIVGYSFYLLHGMAIEMYKGVADYYFGVLPENLALALPVGLLTWLIAVFTYSLIERPFLARSASRPGHAVDTVPPPAPELPGDGPEKCTTCNRQSIHPPEESVR